MDRETEEPKELNIATVSRYSEFFNIFTEADFLCHIRFSDAIPTGAHEIMGFMMGSIPSSSNIIIDGEVSKKEMLFCFSPRANKNLINQDREKLLVKTAKEFMVAGWKIQNVVTTVSRTGSAKKHFLINK